MHGLEPRTQKIAEPGRVVGAEPEPEVFVIGARQITHLREAVVRLADARLRGSGRSPEPEIEHHVGVDIEDEHVREIAAPMEDVVDGDLAVRAVSGPEGIVAVVCEHRLEPRVHVLDDRIDLAPAVREVVGPEVDHVEPLAGIVPDRLEVRGQLVAVAFEELGFHLGIVAKRFRPPVERLVLVGERVVQPGHVLERRETLLGVGADGLGVLGRVDAYAGRVGAAEQLERAGVGRDDHTL